MVAALRANGLAMRAAPWLLLAPLCACAWVGDLDEKYIAAPAPVPENCELPEVEGAHLRGINLVPGSALVTFCVRPVGGGPTVRIPQGSAPCPSALGYGELSAAVGSTEGEFEGWVVATGRCEDIPTTGPLRFRVGDQGGTLGWLGRDSSELRFWPDATPPDDSSYRIRIVHAAPDLGPVDVGTANGAGLPSELTSVWVHGLRFGEVPAAGLSPSAQFDEYGYAQLAPLDFFIGGAPEGTTDNVFATRLAGPANKGRVLTLFITGSRELPASPVRPWLCYEDETSNGLARCETGPGSLLRVETYNANLFGLPNTYDDLRRPALESSIASQGADVICLQGIWPEAQTTALLAATNAEYPHRVHFAYDHGTAFTDPAALDGTTPVLPTGPPCGPAQLEAMNAAVDCMRDECSTMPGDDAGQVSDEACASSSCAGELIDLVAVDEDARCSVCLLVEIPAHSFADIRQTCSSEPTPFAMDGASGTVLLSKLPVEASDDRVVPSTWFRRSVARARVRMSNGVPVDVYCVYSAAVTQSFGIYNGVYGGGASGADAWSNEQRLFVSNLASHVAQRSSPGRALILGTIGVSPDDPQHGITGFDVDVLSSLVAEFPAVVPEGTEPFCTQCADNPLVGGDVSYRFAHILSSGFDARSFRDLSRTRIDSIYTLPGRPEPVPLSTEYGVMVTVDVRP